ncbi:Twin-arginine translocation pathway signal [Rubrobacter xylanophilus DSM 9941]|uniref:Thiamine pyrimidine synthase n=1 Tax=Rubrobacter xylanophilus (strain DSM 9941 / JCM 11954 / NBRC 16129 / PRD-1) TaxID=266117 RepID=Q1ARN7_RUBXD|nr:ABC transporter substrate-binding protein [Rubrobacter xylanophilus]ABG05941.1 Twin-arginine translocation pathway signal [Rubrobacter xylanophilus DSM 9941]
MSNRLHSSTVTRRDFLKVFCGASVGFIGAGGLLTSCGSSSSGSKRATSVTHQLGWLKISQFSGFFAGLEKGYYKDEGIAAKFNAGGPNIIASQVVASERALVGDDDNTTVLQAIDKGQPIVVYGTIFQKSPYAIMSYKDNPIRTLQDFAGKTIALSEATRPQLTPLLEKAGVDLKEVKYVPAGPDPSQLASRQVDGYFGYATSEGVALKQQGLDIIVTYFNDLGFPSYANVLITQPSAVKDNQDTLVRFLRASIRGWEYSLAHPEEMGELVAKKYGPEGLDVETEIAVHKAQAPLIRSPNGPLWIDRDKMEAVIKAAANAGSISKVLPVDEVMTTEIWQKASGGSGGE